MKWKLRKGPFIKDVIDYGGGGFAKWSSYLKSLFSKSDDELGRGRGQKSQKIDDVFLWTAPNGNFSIGYISLNLSYTIENKSKYGYQ